VVSHPIQYYTHRYRQIAQTPGVRLKVLFGSRMGFAPYYDKEFGRTLAWQMPLLEGYEHGFADGGDGGKTEGIGCSLDTFRPDMVWIHGYSDSCTRAAWRWAMSRRHPVFLSGDSNIRKEMKKSLLLRLAKQLLLRPFLSTFTGVLSVGEANEAWYRHYGVPTRKMIRLPFTVDPLLFGPAMRERAALKARLRTRLGIPVDAVVALWCGKITDLKRPLDFVEALAINRESGGPAVWALFAGDGALREIVENRVRQAGVQASFTGFVNVDEIPNVYAASDFLVHTCQQESYGLVAIEAASLGLPMILPASMGAIGETDVARPGINTLVYPDGDLKRLALEIAKMAGNPEERARMAREAGAIYKALEDEFRAGVIRLLENGAEGTWR
jgi:glycosyltransferase involved in cell wall biosynthesis